MTDNIVRREVQRRDDPFGIPACFYWTIDEVADWVESIGYGKYKENFRSHFINGRKLLTVDACVLPKMGITHFGDILELAGYIRDILGKGPTASWLPPLPGPRFYGQAHKLDVVTKHGNDLDYNWRYWVPEFHYGYMPKESPVTREDFQIRWQLNQDACKLGLSKIIESLACTKVSVTEDFRPGPKPPPFKFKGEPSAAPSFVPWTEQKRHITLIDYVQHKMQSAIEQLCSYRIPMWDDLPLSRLPRIYKLQGLAKHIRDQLRIKNNLRGFERFNLRQLAISRIHPSGQYFPKLTFQGHMHEAERVIEARLQFFRKRNMYYSGWTMQRWWDEKLRAEEKIKRAEFYYLSGEERDTKVLIGTSMQDRLHEAAERELCYTEKKPLWPKKQVKKSISCPESVSLTANRLNTHVIGQLNITPVVLPSSSPEKSSKVQEARPTKPQPYLPIVFHWQKMGESKGYPLLKLEKIECGF